MHHLFFSKPMSRIFLSAISASILATVAAPGAAFQPPGAEAVFGVKLYPSPVKGCHAGVCAEGVLISEVVPGSEAARLGLLANDLITKVSSTPTTKVRIVSDVLGTPDIRIPLTIYRKGMFTTVWVGGETPKAAVARGPQSEAEAEPAMAEALPAPVVPVAPGAVLMHPPVQAAPAASVPGGARKRPGAPDASAYLGKLRKSMRLMAKSCGKDDVRIGGTLPADGRVLERVNVSYRAACPGKASVTGTIHGYVGDGLSCANSDMRPLDLPCRPEEARITVEDVQAGE
ncbi:PDZ domain-containing protein [Massilia sp. ST3]|nr:PDZ domain-containing protein [Massilia sp. ST3]